MGLCWAVLVLAAVQSGVSCGWAAGSAGNGLTVTPEAAHSRVFVVDELGLAVVAGFV